MADKSKLYVPAGVPLTPVLHGTGTISVQREVGERPLTQRVTISFQRTVRVADNGRTNSLPPSLGTFPLYKVADFKLLPSAMIEKGGFFFPMYQREAMWIKFKASEPFAIKIYIGGVNAVSGEPARETPETMMRRLKFMQTQKNIQDYVVTPSQPWLDGIANTDGTVRQFVAMPLGKGYTVEAQITGEELIGGLQIEVTPSKVEPASLKLPTIEPPDKGWNETMPPLKSYQIFVQCLSGKRIPLKVLPNMTVDEVKNLIQDREGIPPDHQRLIYEGTKLDDSVQIYRYWIEAGSTPWLVLNLRGGGPLPPPEMGLAAGGVIEQTIKRDEYPSERWEPECGAIFNVQILNSGSFQAVTGTAPPSTPITAATYASHGLPYYKIWDEKPSGVHGDFSGVKSVNEMDVTGSRSTKKKQAAAEVSKSTNNPIVLLNEKGGKIGFRTVSEMEKEVRKRFMGWA